MDFSFRKEAISRATEKFLQNKALLYCVIFLLILKISISVISINFPKNIFFADITKTALVNMLNQTRESLGLQPLKENQKLNQAAEMKAEDMAQKEYFSHTSPQGLNPWYWFLQTGYSYKYAGENLAIGFYDSKEAFDAWINSSSHRANILNQNYKEVGTAVLPGYGPNNAVLVVQFFGSELIKPVAIQQEQNQNTEQEKPSLSANTNEEVLSGTAETPALFSKSDDSGKNGFSSRFLNFIIYNYDTFIQNVIYGFLTAIIGIIIFTVLFGFNIRANKELILRAVIIIVLLSAGALFNKELIINIIPHQVII